ncbi:MAG: hypothetical protein RMK52_04410 [Chitinophagales bacterium]|nr:hypothetical protein [Chitinophagales bacterium]MDW8393469.1 hypothetical protein [Chitinophagales bacterium]
MNLNHHALEHYLTLAREGRLTAEQQEALLTFLEQHPELLEHFPPDLLQVLPDEQIFYRDKNKLKKEITEANCDYFLQLAAEGRLTAKRRRQLEEFLAVRPDLRSHLNGYVHAVLEPDLSVRYPDKNRLYRRFALIVPLWMRAVAAAAVLGLAWLLNGIPSAWQSAEEEPLSVSAPDAVVDSPSMQPVPETGEDMPTTRVVAVKKTAAVRPTQVNDLRADTLKANPVATSDHLLPLVQRYIVLVQEEGPKPKAMAITHLIPETVPAQEPDRVTLLQRVRPWVAALLAASGRPEMARNLTASDKAGDLLVIRMTLALGPLEIERTFLPTTE